MRLGQRAKSTIAQPAKFRPYETDAQGNVVALEDPSRSEASPGDNDNPAPEAEDRYQLDPYGDDANTDQLSPATEDNPFRYQSHYLDSTTATYDMQARAYRPSLGRFLSQDRFEDPSADLTLQQDPLTNNRYAFLAGNPIDSVEWNGHEPASSYTNGCDAQYGSDERCKQESDGAQTAAAATPTYAVSNNWKRGRASTPGQDIKQAKRWSEANRELARAERNAEQQHQTKRRHAAKPKGNLLDRARGDLCGFSLNIVCSSTDTQEYTDGKEASSFLSMFYGGGAGVIKRGSKALGVAKKKLRDSFGGRATKADVGLASRGLRPLAGTRVRPEGVPEGWRIRGTKTGGGTRYYDPTDPGNSVRVMQGSPKSPYPNSQAPYVRWQRNGQPLDANGNVLSSANDPGAHIPLGQFRFRPELFE